jgi:glycosyltransferase involved in cell wall biosynthesis
MIKIAHLTSNHKAIDNRIFFSEIFTLRNYGYDCEIVGLHAKSLEFIHNIRITGIKQRILQRYTFLINAISVFRNALKIKCKVYHFHDPILLPLCAVLRILGTSIVYDVHDDYEASILTRLSEHVVVAQLLSKLWWFFERNISKMFDGIVVADRHLAAKFAGLNPVILGNFPRLDFTAAADTSAETKFNIIYVGGVDRIRGICKVLDALELLPYEDICCHVVGECRDKTLLELLKSNPRVVYHGRVAWTDLHKYYTRAHIGVALYQPVPSFVYCPGENSVKIIEYMAAGIPVICSDFPGLRTFVEDAGYGLTVHPDNPAAIAEKIRFLYENPDVGAQMGQKGRRAFEAEYNWEKHEDKLIALYGKILEKKNSNSLAEEN